MIINVSARQIYLAHWPSREPSARKGRKWGKGETMFSTRPSDFAATGVTRDSPTVIKGWRSIVDHHRCFIDSTGMRTRLVLSYDRAGLSVSQGCARENASSFGIPPSPIMSPPFSCSPFSSSLGYKKARRVCRYPGHNDRSTRHKRRLVIRGYLVAGALYIHTSRIRAYTYVCISFISAGRAVRPANYAYT